MADKSQITFDLGKLEGIRKQLAKGYYAEVGILSDQPHTGDGIGMVELGIIHEFGSITRNIPPRSFLRMPLETKKRELVSVINSKLVNEAFESGNIKKIFEIIGIKAQAIIQEAFGSGGFGKWQKLKEATVKKKKSDAILIDTGELRRSITSRVVTPSVSKQSI